MVPKALERLSLTILIGKASVIMEGMANLSLYFNFPISNLQNYVASPCISFLEIYYFFY